MLLAKFSKLPGHIIVAHNPLTHTLDTNFPDQGPYDYTPRGCTQFYAIVEIRNAEIIQRMFKRCRGRVDIIN